MNTELLAYLKKVADGRESYLLFDDTLRLVETNLLPESLREVLPPGASLCQIISPEDLSGCESLLKKPDSTGSPGAILHLTALSGFSCAYISLLPLFSSRYLILYLFPDRLTLQRSRVFFAPLANLLSRSARHRSESAFSAFSASMAKENGEDPDALTNAAASLFTTSAMLSDFLRLSNEKEIVKSLFDLNALISRIISSAENAAPFGDVCLLRAEEDIRDQLLPVKLSLPYFMKLIAASVSVMAYLADRREIHLSVQRYAPEIYALKFSATSSMVPDLIGHTADFFTLAHRLPEVSLPLVLADHISALLDISILAVPEARTGTASLLFLIGEASPAAEEFKSRDQFSEYDAALKEASFLVFGKRL